MELCKDTIHNRPFVSGYRVITSLVGRPSCWVKTVNVPAIKAGNACICSQPDKSINILPDVIDQYCWASHLQQYTVV